MLSLKPLHFISWHQKEQKTSLKQRNLFFPRKVPKILQLSKRRPLPSHSTWMEYGWWSYCSPRTQGALLYKVDPTLGNQSSREDRDSLDGEGGIVFTRISIGCGVVISLRRKYYLHTHRKDKKDDMQWAIPYWLYPNKIKERYKRKTITVILISRLVQWQCSRDRVSSLQCPLATPTLCSKRKLASLFHARSQYLFTLHASCHSLLDDFSTFHLSSAQDCK